MEARRRVRYLPSDDSRPNYGRVGWAYPPGTYDPETVKPEDDGWTIDPDDVDVPQDRDLFPNFAAPEDFIDLPESNRPTTA